ncbi:MAG TPA: class I SAM-dependent methyltransferase [Streptosporangiaceae bacterium]|nr:class I SAM-dependent methyltransferase [Streptosporangiaceae bacterium]
MTLQQGWDSEASNWVQAARTPSFDYAYETINRPALISLLPPPGQRTLELGCGEGRVSRLMRELGHQVVGADASPTMIGSALTHPAGVPALVADAAAVPFGDETFDLVVAHLSLQDIDDMPKAIAEAARVLMPSGKFYLAITHPTSTAGSFQGGEPDAPFVIAGSYLDPFRSAVRIDRGEINLTFHSEHRPLEAYAAALEAAGLLIEKLRELPASAAAVDRDPGNLRWQRVPMFLHLLAIKPG